MPQFIAPVAGLVGAVGGLIGQKRQQKRTSAWEDTAMGGLQGYGQTGLQDFNLASQGYQQAFQNPEQFTATGAADLGKYTQSQLGGISRIMGRSGMAGASARDLLTENTKMALQQRLNAKLGALGGLGDLGRTGAGAYGGMLSGAEGIARTNLLQNAQAQNIFEPLGKSLFDIFSGMGKKNKPVFTQDPGGGGF